MSQYTEVAEDSQAVMGKLSRCFSRINDKWLADKPKPCAAIAYDWYYPNWGDTSKIDILINVVRADRQGKILILDDPYVLEIKLKKVPGTKARGSSEPIGLVPRAITYDKDALGIIERNMSDFFISLLYDDILVEDEGVVLFQGPFSPKLVGRLGYRHLPSKLTFAAITFKSEWFPLIVPDKNEKLNWKLNQRFLLDIESSCGENNSYYQLADTSFSSGLNEVLKSWIVRESSKTVAIVEVFNQFNSEKVSADDSFVSPWVSKLKSICETWKYPSLIFENGLPVWLPFTLACSYDLCKRRERQASNEFDRTGREHLQYIRFYEEDVEKMYANSWMPTEVVGRRTLLYLAMFDVDLYATLQKKIGLEATQDQEHRGLNISSYIKDKRQAKKWSIDEWRKVI